MSGLLQIRGLLSNTVHGLLGRRSPGSKPKFDDGGPYVLTDYVVDDYVEATP